jgi:hypothetical protein
MKNLSKILCVLCVLCGAISAANAQTKLTSKVLLIPLDDRPPCLQFPVKMGLIGDVEVVTPPRNLLGRFTEFGKPDEIIKWIKTQNLKSFDATIVSLDMLSYGGLVAMREYETTESEALKRADFIRELRKSAPKMPIYGSSVIMRLAPTGNVVNESYRANLAKWAEISVDESKKTETLELEKKIPAEALEKYKKARQRDLKLNLYAVELVRDKVIDYLILSQDDAKPNGVHVADREQLIEYVKSNNLGEKVAVQPGADEVSMLLLARSMTSKYNYRPKIKAIYSDEKIADQFMPYEDRPLRKTVSFHIKAVGATEVAEEKDADILFYVFVSRFEKGRAESFANEIRDRLVNVNGDFSSPKLNTKPFIIADVDPKGEIQGADKEFTEKSRYKGLLRGALGYASWNTAGNTIGTAIPHGLLMGNSLKLIELKFRAEYKKARSTKSGDKSFRIAGTDRTSGAINGPSRRSVDIEKLSDAQKLEYRVFEAQTWFKLNRLLDDYFYHSILRPQAITFAKDKGWNVFRFDDLQTKQIEEFCQPKLRYQVWQLLNSISSDYENVDKFKFSLPWGRTFEAEIDFEFSRNGIL